MITRKELLESKEYWLEKIQNNLFHEIEQYISDKKITQTQFANMLGYGKSYVSQILNGNFDHKLSKLIELAITIEKVPEIEFISLKDVLEYDDKGMDYTKECKIQIVVNYENSFKFNSRIDKKHSIEYQSQDTLISIDK